MAWALLLLGCRRNLLFFEVCLAVHAMKLSSLGKLGVRFREGDNGLWGLYRAKVRSQHIGNLRDPCRSR
jgi:hypothetical protein